MPAWTRYRRGRNRSLEGPRTDVMKTSSRISQAGWAIALALLLGLAGCGSSSSSSDSLQAKKKAAHGKLHIDPTKRPVTDMVAAVTAGKAGPPVEMRFELREPPQPGQPLDVDVAILPDVAGIDRISGRFQGGEGFELIGGGDLTAVEKPVPGTPIRHVLQLLPKKDGIFTVSAVVSVDRASDTITRTFSIPVIVGVGLPEQTAKADVADAKAVAGADLKSH